MEFSVSMAVSWPGYFVDLSRRHLRSFRAGARTSGRVRRILILTTYFALTAIGANSADAADRGRPDAGTKSEAPAFPLADVIAQTQAALDQYNRDPATVQGTLPYLTSADFDFKTVTQETTGGKITFLIFTIGASRQSSVTSDAEFLYQAPPKPTASKSAAPSIKAPAMQSMVFLVTEPGGKFIVTEHGAKLMADVPSAAASAHVIESSPKGAKARLTYSDNLVNTLRGAAKAVQDQQDTIKKAPNDPQAMHFCTLNVTLGFGVQYDGNGAAGVPVGTLVTVGLNIDANKNTTQTVKLTFKGQDSLCKS